MDIFDIVSFDFLIITCSTPMHLLVNSIIDYSIFQQKSHLLWKKYCYGKFSIPYPFDKEKLREFNITAGEKKCCPG